MARRIKLDERLSVLQRLIEKWTPSGGTHVDIGSDHGGLLQQLCRGGHISRGIAVENKSQPFRNSQVSLSDLPVDVRFGDGLSPIATGEADSLSIAGMGGRSITEIVKGSPKSLPSWIFLQPNKDADLVRSWALETQFYLVDEVLTQDLFVLLAYQSSSQHELPRNDPPQHDPLYREVENVGQSVGITAEISAEAALLFGPMLLLKRDRTLHQRLCEEREFYGRMTRRTAATAKRIQLIDAALTML